MAPYINVLAAESEVRFAVLFGVGRVMVVSIAFLQDANTSNSMLIYRTFFISISLESKFKDFFISFN
jgi:hypothetical protein